MKVFSSTLAYQPPVTAQQARNRVVAGRDLAPAGRAAKAPVPRTLQGELLDRRQNAVDRRSGDHPSWLAQGGVPSPQAFKAGASAHAQRAISVYLDYTHQEERDYITQTLGIDVYV